MRAQPLLSTARDAAALRSRILENESTRIEVIDPADGAHTVFRDTCVMARFSTPADPASLSSATFRIEDDDGIVPATLRLSPDRRVLIWKADRPLVPGMKHVVQAHGLRDAQGRPMTSHSSHFVPCDLASTDWPPY